MEALKRAEAGQVLLFKDRAEPSPGRLVCNRMVPNDLQVNFGHCGRSGVAVREAASGQASAIRTRATRNVTAHCGRMRTLDPLGPLRSLW